MTSIIKKVPVPICGVALGSAALGNLLLTWSPQLRILFGCISAILILLAILKLICYPAAVAEELKSPIPLNIACTFDMALMLLSVYAKPFIPGVARVVWYFAILMHVVLILCTTKRYVFNFDLKNIHASWYVTYVGIVVAAVTAPAWGRTDIGTVAFWFGFVALLILLVIVTIRYVKYPVPAPAKPVFCIYAAPMSLCIAGYVQSVQPKSATFLTAMVVAAFILYVAGIIQMLRCIRGPFFPSFASFTFPFTISGIASIQASACLASLGSPIAILRPWGTVQAVITTVLTSYVIFKYVVFLTSDPQK